jgi:putative OPT family oligopeptide transporter
VNIARALSAPQAALISALAQGVIQGNLDWSPIGIGALVGVAVIAVDETLRRTSTAHLSPLAVGMGIYLPTAVTLITAVGAVVGFAYEARAKRCADPPGAKQLGVLLASGMIVGESLIGVLLAAVVVFSGRGAPLALVGDAFAHQAIFAGGIGFAISIIALYAWLNRLGGPA